MKALARLAEFDEMLAIRRRSAPRVRVVIPIAEGV